MLTINNTFSRRKRYCIYLRLLRYSFTSRVPCVPVFDIPASHTWCPKVPSLASPSPESPHTRPHVPVPLSPSHFYTQPNQVELLPCSTTWFQTSRYCHAKVEFNSINLVRHGSSTTFETGLRSDGSQNFLLSVITYKYNLYSLSSDPNRYPFSHNLPESEEN